MKSRLTIFLVFMLFAVRAAGDSPDLKPPQVTVNFIFPPSPLMQDGTARLVYEMVITNYVPFAYTLESINVEYANGRASYSSENLKHMIRFAGEPASAAPRLKIDGGQTAVVFLMLQFENAAQIPRSLEHTLHFRSPDGTDHALASETLAVEQRPPLIVEPPLRGSDWIAGDSVHNGPDAAHRRAMLFADGEAYVAQRYAIDWVRYRIVNGVGRTWTGPEDRNSSYFCYGAPIYSMTSGTVTDVLDGIAENVPHSGKIAIDVNFRNAGGNHVVIYAGYGLYAFYAHMRPGTIKVKPGDHVSTGELLGEVGNSGNSTEPHLHEHIVNRPSFLAGQGVPYEFAHFEASRPVGMTAGPHDEMYFKNIGARKSFIDDYPAVNAAVSFQ